MLLAAGAALPVVIFAGIVVWRLVVEQRAATERQLVQTARTQTAALEREMAATIRILQALAHLEPLDQSNLAAFHDEARRVQQSQPAWYNVILFAADGRELVSVLRPSAEPLRRVTDQESFDRVIATRQPAIGGLVRGPIEGPLGVPIRVPVHRDGQIAGVLTAIITPERFADALFRDRSSSGKSVRTIVDTRGTIVATTRKPDQAVGKSAAESLLARARRDAEGVYRDAMPDGREVYVAFSRSESSGWTAAVAVPADALDGPLRRSAMALAAIGLLALFGGAAGALLLSRRLTADIGAAADAAQALAGGADLHLPPSIVTEVRRLGDSLERSAKRLNDHQRERDEHLAQAEAARRDAETANSAKDQFLAMLGHELRNPLSPIVTALQLMRMRDFAWPREFGVIERQVRHLTRLVDDLLDVSRITRGKVELKSRPIEIHSIITQAVEMTSPLLEQQRHQLAVNVPDNGLMVNGDVDRLAQVFANLLSNAAKYTPPGGHIQIVGRRDSSEVVVDISDNGQGLPPHLVPRVFDLFVQGPRGSDRREGGMGLGLTLVRSLVTLHHGRVEAYSDGPSQGSTFTVRLPVVAAGPETVERLAATTSLAIPTTPRRLLIVDDNFDAAEMLASVLRERQHSVQIAHDGPAALASVDEFVPDVAVLDIGLPVMDGYEVATRLRETLGASAPAFIALTGYGQANDHDRSRAAGFSAHFVKPVDIDRLLQAIEAAAGGDDAPRSGDDAPRSSDLTRQFHDLV